MPEPTLCIGIDFGTTNSSAAYAVEDARDCHPKVVNVHTVRVVIDETQGTSTARVPTILAARPGRSGRPSTLLGWELFRDLLRPRRRAELLRHGHTFFRSVKSDLGTYRTYPRAFSPDYALPEKVAGAILHGLLDETRRSTGLRDLSRAHVVLSVPASLNELGRRHTLDAACHAGLRADQVELIDEPAAALLDYLNDSRAAPLLEDGKPHNLLIFDYGGGTLDLALVKARLDVDVETGLHLETLGVSAYKRLGGDDVDRAIMDACVWKQIEAATGVRRANLQPEIRAGIEDTLTPTVARRLKESMCRKLVTDRRHSTSWAAGAESTVVEALQQSFVIPDHLARIPRQFTFSARDFRQVMRPFLAVPHDSSSRASQSLLSPVMELIDSAKLDPSQLDAIVLHGGSCRNPLVRELITQQFAERPTLFTSTLVVETPDLDASVARGAAIAGYWKHVRGREILRPILGEELGIITRHEQPVVLLPSGQPLPFPDERGVHELDSKRLPLFVGHSGTSTMLVPVYAGTKRRIATSIQVDLPTTARVGDPVRIKLRVDRDKTLRWWFSVGEGAFRAASVLENPWSAERLSREEQALIDHRRQMHRLVREGLLPTVDDEQSEAWLLLRARRDAEAEDAAHACIARDGPTSSMANLLGQVHARREDYDKSEAWHTHAIRLRPNDPVLAGNLAMTLLAARKFPEAINAFRGAIAIDASLAYVHIGLGDALQAAGNEAAARAEYMEALRIIRLRLAASPDSERDWLEAHNIHLRLGDYEQADSARQRLDEMFTRHRLGGDAGTLIASPDSGFISSSEIGT